MEQKNLTLEQMPQAISEILARVQKIETCIDTAPNQTTTSADPEPFIYGINGLAKFLQVSTPTAQKIKNSGKIRYSQADRTIIFRKDEVLNALSNKRRGSTNA